MHSGLYRENSGVYRFRLSYSIGEMYGNTFGGLDVEISTKLPLWQPSAFHG
jgi:hypothetical protein